MKTEIRANIIFLVLLAASCLIFVPLIPIETVPEIKFRLVGQNGAALSQTEIVQIWRHPLYDFTEHQTASTSDETGTVVFAKQETRISFIRLLWGTVKNNIRSNPHNWGYEYRPNARFALGAKEMPFEEWKLGEIFPTTIIVDK